MSEAIPTGAIVIFMMLLFYMVCGTLIEKHQVSFGHEASFTVILGMLISYLAFMQDNKEVINLMRFDDNAFFFFCLPPIVFASGFNMQRGDFFANISNILLFGVLGTFVAFFSFSSMTILLKRSFQMK